ncbi:polycomb group RING finger protein 6-like [Apodemus sylvaticus]|uniref:polycomb group RING finger protein 6-like n=1 Tax=Apodemus sylvaticus TaxID=10129 RepID=UPI002243B45F|nr:polycomb group RING finger protein 6-like [Apodemus sylvaticus]
MSLPRLSPAEPVMESSPEAQEVSQDAAKPERAEGAEGPKETLWPVRQGLPPAGATAPPSGKEDQSSSGEVGTQECLASKPSQLWREEGKAEEKAAVEAEQEEHLLPLSEMIPYISCSICKGYLIDAATITECLHTFCKSCIVKHFEHSNRCPKCNIIVHEAKPHINLRMDPQLQNIVYKLVAGLEEKEIKQRREFYKENCLGTPNPTAVPQPCPSDEENTKEVVE